jgi:hypothetical protein
VPELLLGPAFIPTIPGRFGCICTGCCEEQRVLGGASLTRDTFAFFRHCHDQRWAHFWMITSETCARCGITYAAHFDHPERCRFSGAPWSTMTGSTPSPAPWRTSSGP